MYSTRYILTSLTSVFLMRVSGIFLQMLWFILLTKTLPIALVGIYSIIYAVLFLVRALGAFGMDLAFVKYTPTLSIGEIVTLHRYAVRFCLKVHAIFYIMLLPGVLWLFWQDWQHPHFHLILLTLLIAPAYMLNALQSGKLLAKEKQVRAHFPESILLPSGLILITLTLVLVDAHSLLTILTVQTMLVWLVFLLYRFFVRSVYPYQEGAEQTAFLSEFRQTAFRMFGTLALNNLNLRLPILITPLLLGVTATAFLETATRFGSLLGLMQWCMAFVVMPIISKTHQAGNIEMQQKLLTISCWLVFLPALALFLLLLLYGIPLITLLTQPEYQAAYLPMILIAAGFLMNAASGPTTHIYMLTGQERVTLRIAIGETALTVFLILVLGSWLGLIGIGWAIFFGLFVRNVWLNVRLHQYTGLYPGIWSWKSYTRLFQYARGKMKR